ncbi:MULTISPECIES: TcpQ domain-containing protein [Pseudomonas]|uniref:TcpQ domain-containing protein n=1 Tax=Pseudomonas TaxID=286 RepID=UPI000F0207D8|nr:MULTISPECIES: TcpQ domain-containing protein [Pseudomonas]MBD8615351.1 toxin co-regulated pilus biosynthesis Q family protein [Pseudomonas putida]MBD8681995.1 toxin co-regulated pilus biosynthesis Q family protein [Pseudomonas sp. CFBP 13719]
MARKLNLLTAALISATCANAAYAELYISPVVRDSVTYQQPAAPVAPAAVLKAAPAPVQAPVPVPASNGQVVGSSTVHGAFEMKDEKKAGVMSFGKNVPLFAAMENLVPQSKTWAIVFEPGTENTPVSWRDAADWRAALTQISQNNRLVIAINDGAKRISVSRTAELAKKLAQPGTQVWSLQAGKSMRENLDAWAKKAGWQVDWSKTEANYPVDHSANLVGYFAGKGGVVDKLMSATQGRDVPLTAKFYRGNNVVVISEAGYSPEHSPSTPITDDEQY